ncbi:MAG: tRNA 2-thiocytidine(32) synthetase TtcA [Myxococcota bacterium]|nr:tRNA 2-thiocytidine(32) synthetase TtcA [Myxococcota bacterium]
MSDELETLVRRVRRRVGRCIATHRLREDGDRVLVAGSGGKDSHVLLDVLERLRRDAPVRFELVAVHLDQGQPGHDPEPLRAYLEARAIPYRIVREDTFAVVTQKLEPGATYCSLCSRLRRGVLHRVADEIGANRIALGHHRDDAIETLLLNLLFAGSIGAMPPALRSERGHVIIRPLYDVPERDVARYAALAGFPILPCRLCGSQPDLMRDRVTRWLDEIEREHPHVRDSLAAALGNVRPSHLADRRLLRALDRDDADAPSEAASPAIAGLRVLPLADGSPSIG